MKQVAATAIGGGVFTLSYLAFGLPLAISTVAALGAYGAGLFLFFPRKKTGDDLYASQVDDETARQLINEAASKVDAIETLNRRIQKPQVKLNIQKLVTLARGILDDIRKDPKDIKRARQFLNYYLDAVTRILTHYTELMDRGIDSTETRKALEKVEALLTSLENAFERQRATLARDELLDLSSEIMVLESTLDMEGKHK